MDGNETSAQRQKRLRIARMLRNPATPTAKLLLYFNHSDPFFRAALAKNPNAPVEVLELLARDPELEVRRQAFLNMSTPMALLKEMLGAVFLHGGSHEDQLAVMAGIYEQLRAEHPPAPSWATISNERRQAKNASE